MSLAPCVMKQSNDAGPVESQGLSVYQWGDAACVQRLGYGSPGFPSPGEALLTADGPPGGSIALAGHRKVPRPPRAATSSHIRVLAKHAAVCLRVDTRIIRFSLNALVSTIVHRLGQDTQTQS